ncbi:peptidase M24, structural domain-containing protein [Mycena pura]|uniref:Peptidase M24, structural domain-containing protein n=1 Tax=Mycena pura TaxID=153505 RepID=A0AAD6V456_9AGAR|nr:peptidase M24, structural domain-containing protein [Mycena pura]
MLRFRRLAFSSVFTLTSHVHPRSSITSRRLSMGTGSQTVHTTQRLETLRKFLAQEQVHAFLVPSEDQHSSEYIASCDERRAFISGFNGSAGFAVITRDKALLFTDGRYFLQAEQQLDENWTLMKQGLPDVPTWQEFLSKDLEASSCIGIDPTLISAADADALTTALKPKGSELVSFRKNPIDSIWADDRPPRPKSRVLPLDIKYSGESHLDKIKRLREVLSKKEAKALVVSMLDEVAWLFNLRGADIAYNPVFFAYAIITQEKVILFVEPDQLDEDARRSLGDQITIQPYTSFFDALRGLAKELDLGEKSKVLLGNTSSFAVAEAVGEGNYTLAPSPVAELKAIKNETEMEGFRQSHIRDGAALARYFAWLEEQLESGAVLNESQAADKLEEFRSELDLFRGLSFPTISSTGPNGAIIHYQPDANDCAVIKKDQMYLCDSGAQFFDGTTDVTRTWHFGTATAEEKRAFTRVLQGHIAIDTAIFPNGTTGYILDTLARKALWQDGLGRHGTGHGVGHYLNVHEGPQGMGLRIAYNSTALKPGMTLSNEPGYYADGKFGIRIENIVLVRKVDTPNNFGDKGFLGFENVTMCPIQTNLIDRTVFTADEVRWLNAYHAEVFDKVSGMLQNDPRALEWLKRECAAI